MVITEMKKRKSNRTGGFWLISSGIKNGKRVKGGERVMLKPNRINNLIREAKINRNILWI